MPDTIEEYMARIGAVRCPPDTDGFEAFLDAITEFSPKTLGFWKDEHGVVHTYPRVRGTGGCGCARHYPKGVKK
jgi:hypothetical protein